MSKNLFLIFSILLLSNTFFVSCKNHNTLNKKTIDDSLNLIDDKDYHSRITNIISYLKENQNISMDTCRFIFVLQTNKCNSCTKEKLENIYREIKENKIGSPLFILHTKDQQVLTFLNKQFAKPPLRVIIDKNNQLGTYGLSFMKNIFIQTCDNKIKSWKFYE